MIASQIFAVTVTVAFIVVSCAVGIRLLRLHRRSGESPELSMGLGLLAMGGSQAIYVASAAAESPNAELMRFVATCMISTGSVLFVAFCRTVFRPDERWATALLWGMGVGFVALTAVAAWDTVWGDRPLDRATALRSFAIAVGWVWMFVESMRQRSLQRKRARFGLDHPVVANRYLLWAIVSGGSVANLAISTWIALSSSLPNTTNIAALSTTGVLGLIGAISLALAFAPPRRYVEWLQRPARDGAPQGAEPTA